VAVSSIYFIDDRVQDKEALFSDIDASAKWFVLDSSLDGIYQMQKILSSYRNLDSVQIISHGSIGAINIGSSVLNSTNLTYYQTQLQDSLRGMRLLRWFSAHKARVDLISIKPLQFTKYR